jgi:hypothetical protein
MVQMAIEDLETRHLTEKSFESLAVQAGLGTEFLPSHMLFFPGRSYSDEEIAETFQKNEISAVLKISVSGVGAMPVYIPRRATTSTSGSSSGMPTATGWSMSGTSTSTTKETGGYYAQAPFANFRLELIDLVTERVVLLAMTRQTFFKDAIAQRDLAHCRFARLLLSCRHKDTLLGDKIPAMCLLV